MADKVRIYPTVAVRQLVEEAFREDADPASKIRELEMLGEQLSTIQGTIGQYIGTLDKLQTAARHDYDMRVVEARENADIRDEMIRRGFATAEELEARGYRSHDELDRMEADGSLEQELQEGIGSWGLALLKGTAFEQAIRRNRRTGQFMDIPGMNAPPVRVDLPGDTATGGPPPPPAPRPTRVRRAARPSYTQKAEPKRVAQAPRGGKMPAYYSPEHGPELERLIADYANLPPEEHAKRIHPALTKEGHDALRELETGLTSGMGTPISRASIEAELDEYDRGVHPQQSTIIRADIERDLPHTAEAIRQAAYEERQKDLEKALARLEREGVASTTEAEAEFNAAGHVSQHTLLRFAREALSTPSTVDLHSSLDENDNRVWDDDRMELHAAIIDLLLRKKKEVPDPDNPGETKMVFDPEGEYYPDAGEMRTVLFSGGGYSAGKGTVLKRLAKEGRIPEEALKIDPDEIKALLPEFDETLEGDPEANLRVYEEAWEIAQELQRKAQKQGMNVIVDGITDTSKEEVEDRLLSFIQPGKDGGKTYVNPQIIYVDIPTEEAITRAKYRAEHADKPSDRRYIPEPIIRAVHRDVASTIPGVTEMAGKHGVRVEVWDNNQGQYGDGAAGYEGEEIPAGKEGKFRPPKRMLQAGPNQYEIQDEKLFDSLLEKSAETIPGVDDGSQDAPAKRLARYFRSRLDLMGLTAPKKGDVATETLGTFKDTFDKWSIQLPDGSFLWDPTRKALHEQIIEDMLTDGEGNPLPVIPVNERKAIFTAGVPASGKSTMVGDLWKRLTGTKEGEDPSITPAHIDADRAREGLPEIKEMIDAGDRYSGAGSQREARHLARQAYDRAVSRGNNLVVEGTGGGLKGVFHEQIRKAQQNGYEPRVLVTELPAHKAKERAQTRSLRDKRVVDMSTIDRYSDEVPARFAEWSQDSTIGWELYSNDVPYGVKPKLLARRSPNGQIEFVDEEAYREFLKRARWARERGNDVAEI